MGLIRVCTVLGFTELLFAELSTTTAITSLICSVGRNVQPSYSDNKDFIILTPEKGWISLSENHSQCPSMTDIHSDSHRHRWTTIHEFEDDCFICNFHYPTP